VVSHEESVTQWIEQLKAGHSSAAGPLWQRYVERLVRLASNKLGELPRRAADEEDVVLSAFRAFFAGVRDGRFQQLDDRDDLWQVLVMLTERKAIALRRHERAAKRGDARVRGESAFVKPDQSAAAGLDQIADREPTPEFAAEVAENLRELLDRLQDDSQRQVALAKLEGYTNQELAQQLGISLRAVERKLQYIRRTWEQKGSEVVVR
jgi:RNA polymerase sigma factor (sigma-70 family)